MSIQFIWEEKYAVGDPEIDSQHQRLFSLVNEVPETPSAQDIKQTIMFLFKYTRKHFRAEEDLMDQMDYPGLSQHQALHEDLIGRLSDVANNSWDTQDSIILFKQFVYDWLTHHILSEDKRFFEFAHTCKAH